ncbi:MAG: HAD-IA family hydrolase [Gallionellaceae bacterium]
MGKRFDLIIFDWDGTVMDSTAVIARSIQAASRDLDLTVPTDEVARHVIGLGLDQALRYAVPDCPPQRHVDLVARYRFHFFAQENEMHLFAGAEELISNLKDTGYFLAVATGKNRNGLDRALLNSKMTHYFHSTRTADQTVSKPDPTMLHEILAELEIDVSRALMVGDTTHDLQMAINAGMPSLAMTHGAHPPEQLQALQPLALLDDFKDLREWLQTHA